MKVFKSRGFALAVLVLVIVAGSVYGLSRKPIAVEYHQWIADDAGVLTAETQKTIKEYNEQWEKKYKSAAVAVAAVDSTHGWSGEKYASMLGKEWNLGQNDMLLLLVKNDNYYVALGDSVAPYVDEAKIKSLIDGYYYDDGDYDRAALSFFRAADVVYDQMSKG